jgi:hypothetical protein
MYRESRLITADVYRFVRGIYICHDGAMRRMPWSYVEQWEKQRPLTFPAKDKIDLRK